MPKFAAVSPCGDETAAFLSRYASLAQLARARDL